MAKLKTSGLLFIAAFIILTFIIVGYFSIQKKENAIVTNAIEAVPIDASYILELPKIKNITSKIVNDSSIFYNLLNISELNNLKNQISEIDSFIEYSKTFKEIVKNEKIIISAHIINSSELNFLTAFKIPAQKQQKNLIKEIYSFLNSSDSTIRNYSNTDIFSFETNTKKFYFCIIDNIFVMSKSELLIENSIRQKQSNNPISLDFGFKQTAKTLSKNRIHLFVNYNYLPDYLSAIFTHTFQNKIQPLKSFANWSALDINIDHNFLNISGLSYSSDSPDMFLSMFKNNKPQKLNIDEYLPYKTAEFMSFSVEDFAIFFALYEKYLSSKNLSGTHSNQFSQFNTEYSVNIKSDIIPQIGNSVTLAKVKFNNTTDNFSEFLIFEVKSKSSFETILNQITTEYLTGTQTLENLKHIYEVDNANSIYIYEFPVENFTKLIVGEIFSTSKTFKYYIFLNNYLVFAPTIDELKKFYYSYYTNKSLVYNEDYKNYKKRIPEKSNIFYYSNNNFNSLNQITILKDNFGDVYKQNLNTFNKFQFITLQYSYDKKDLFQTHFNAKYNKNLQNRGVTVWEKEIKANVSKKPVFFLNHYSFKKEVLIADDSNYIYLIAANGEFLWIKHLREPIIDNFQKVDFYNNNKYQILLTTTNNIITFDRNGEVVMDKCLQLPAATTKGASIINYDDNNNYRIFVPCVNNKVYLYDNNLKAVTGWNIPTTQTSIVSKIYYFSYENKDYIVFGDKTKPYILNRKGEERINVKQNIALPNNCSFYFQEKTASSKAGFITTDAAGQITFIDLLGNVTFKNLITLSSNHKFIANDITSDGNLDYVLTDDKTLYVYNFDGSKIFSHTFSKKITGTPSILHFSDDNIQIGISIENENNIYIFNSNGTIANNFPLRGNSLFSVGMLSSQENFSIIVGQNNFLYNYLLY